MEKELDKKFDRMMRSINDYIDVRIASEQFLAQYRQTLIHVEPIREQSDLSSDKSST